MIQPSGNLIFDAALRQDERYKLDLAFEARPPATALIGPSGSGKTTVMEMIAGLRRSGHARIAIGDRVLTDTSAGVRLAPERRGLGIVFQDALLFPHMSVERNLRYGERRAGERIPDFGEVVELLEIGSLLGRRPSTLSGGEQRRVALGRAILSGPRWLMLDEPLSALDDALRGRILGWLERASQRWSIPILFSSHNQAEVRRLASWVVAIDNGVKIAEGPPETVLGDPHMIERTDELGPQNLLCLDEIEGPPERAAGRLGDQTVQLPPLPPYERPPIYVQFSPEAVILGRGDPEGLSARNHLLGKVVRIDDAHGSCLVLIGIDGTPARIWARITPSARLDLGLTPGAPVYCLVKAHSMQVLG